MPEYLSPGVYVEEIANGPRPIQGVGTSTAGFVGRTERGPTRPKLVSNWGEYTRWFGDTVDPAISFMPNGVRGFFENAGARAFIARVVSIDGVNPADVASSDLVLQGANFLRVRANGAGAWGNNIIIWVRDATRRDMAAVPPRDWFRITVLYYRDGAPDVFVDPNNPANVNNPLAVRPTVVEDFDNLTHVDGRSNHAVGLINSSSKLIEVAYDDGGGNPAPSGRPVNTLGATETATVDLTNSNNADVLRVTSRFPGGGGNALTVTVAPGTNANTFQIQVSDGGNLVETYDNIADATPEDAATTINAQSPRIRAEMVPPGNTSRPDDVAAAPLLGGADSTLGGGDDGATITPGDFSGDAAASPDLRTGLAGLELIDEISLLVAPDEVNGQILNADQITQALLDQCERLRDRFAILSSPELSGDVQNIVVPRDSSYGAFYFPWIRVFEARLQDTMLVPPAGHIAGIYARSDRERGVHKAPANEVVRGMVYRDVNSVRKPLQYDVGKGGQDILNPQGVNVIRDFRADGRSIRVWGARTMSSDPLWRYINVRRLFLYVEESIDEGTQWVVFEPNYEPTWAKVRQSVINFLMIVWRSGALRGVTQEEAFFVRCDRTTMTEAEIDAGMLICEVGIAPVKPAEFVIFRIQQKTLDQTS